MDDSTKDSRTDREKAAEVDRILEEAGIELDEDPRKDGETTFVVAPLRRERAGDNGGAA